ncbi:MAG: site-2 protease family protein [Gemmataceae bacterium]|nr:site-2 protease family protein [Gemmataceae bacterium]
MENRDDLQRDGMTPKPPVPNTGADAADTGIRAGAPVPPAPGSPGSNAPEYPPAAETPADASPTFGQWLASNGIVLLIAVGVVGILMWRYEPAAVIKVAIGLSFVIFIHELGHFLAAKWCDVQVSAFSIGFGPAIPGCWFQWGETTYKFALFPLGGYVQMLGQVDGDESSDGSEEDPRSYRNKTVGQRMLIISAGVIMNVILAFLCFIAVYRINGKDRTAAVVDTIDSHAPSFRQGIRTGMTVEQIGSRKDPTFEDLMTSVVFTSDGETVKFIGRRAYDAEPLELDIIPRLEKGDTRPMIGVGFASRLELASSRLMGPDSTGPYWEGSPASRATPKLRHGDWIIATTDPDDPAKVMDLPRDPRNQQNEQPDFFEFQRRLMRLAGQEVTLRVRHTDGTTEDVKVPPAFHYTLGLRMRIGQIVAIRDGSPAAKAEIVAASKTNQRDGDVILRVEVSKADGSKEVLCDEKTLDPERLPYQLQQWADGLRNAKAKAPWTVTLHLRRHRIEGLQEFDRVTQTLEWDDSWRFDRVVPQHQDSPMAIPELGLAYQIKPDIAGTLPGPVPSKPLERGDVIQQLVVTTQLGDDERTDTLEIGNNWAYVSYWLYQRTAPITMVQLKIKQGKDTETVTIVPTHDDAWPLADRGWIFMPDERREKADSIAEAIGLGLRDTGRFMTQVFQTLRGMITSRLSTKLLGGPITIARTAYRIAGYDMWEFIFFLGLISVNLAVINFLPIPVLDGGHMVFLLYEKVFRKPASEAVRIGATYAGLAVILSLMIFVLYLDLFVTRR